MTKPLSNGSFIPSTVDNLSEWQYIFSAALTEDDQWKIVDAMKQLQINLVTKDQIKPGELEKGLKAAIDIAKWRYLQSLCTIKFTIASSIDMKII